MQCLAIQMLEEDRVKKDRLALQKHFRMKKDHCLKRLREMGMEVKVPPQATFYLWVSLKNLPAPINSGLVFAEEALKEKVCVTPGSEWAWCCYVLELVLTLSSLAHPSPQSSSTSTPASAATSSTALASSLVSTTSSDHSTSRQLTAPHRLHHLLAAVRLSFGPALEELDRGLDGLARLIKKAQEGHEDIGKNYKPHREDTHHHNVHSAPSAGS